MVKSNELPAINVTIKETGTQFVLGEAFRPEWGDVIAVFHKMYELELDVLPQTFHLPDTFLMTTNQSSALEVIPYIIQRIAGHINSGHKTYTGNNVKVFVWVLAWYAHLYGHDQPRPKVRATPVVRKVYQPLPHDMGCPFCTKTWKPRDGSKPKVASKYFVEWFKWLEKHAKTYHQWDIKAGRYVEPKRVRRGNIVEKMVYNDEDALDRAVRLGGQVIDHKGLSTKQELK
jgi:hypothetical protein